MKLLVEDSKKIRDHFNAILRQSWVKGNKRDTLKMTAKGYCMEFPESTWEISELYTTAKKSL